MVLRRILSHCSGSIPGQSNCESKTQFRVSFILRKRLIRLSELPIINNKASLRRVSVVVFYSRSNAERFSHSGIPRRNSQRRVSRHFHNFIGNGMRKK